MRDGVSVHLHLRVSVCACVHVCVCVPVGGGEKENILSNPPEQFRRAYSYGNWPYLVNILKQIEETNLVCICKFHTVIFF